MLRRFGALLSAIVLGHLVMIESGFACEIPAADPCDMAMESGAGTSTDSGMGDMGAGMATDAAGTDQRDETGTDCRFPWAPAGCVSAIPCGPAALTTATLEVATAAATSRVAAELVVLSPDSLARPPALPPPRS